MKNERECVGVHFFFASFSLKNSLSHSPLLTHTFILQHVLILFHFPKLSHSPALSLSTHTHCQCSTPSRKIQLLWLQPPPKFLQCGIQVSFLSPVANTTSTFPSKMSSPNAHSFSFPFAAPRTNGSVPSTRSKATGKVPAKMQMLQTCTFH